MTETIEEVASWWDSNPQLYGETYHTETNKEYFDDIDACILNYRYDAGPRYEDIIREFVKPEELQGQRGLEIGYGSGWLTEWLIRQGIVMSGIDLTERAFHLTSKRLSVRGLTADLHRGDARTLPFAHETFSLVCSIGVLHHSPDLQNSIDEVHRVLKPGAKAVLMLYSKDSVFSMFVHLIRGVFERESSYLNKADLWNRWTDGWEQLGNAWTVPTTENDIKKLFSKFSQIETVSFYFGLPHWITRLIPNFFKRGIARRYGWFRYIIVRK
jgi:SAM-dependent methyltransferase